MEEENNWNVLKLVLHNTMMENMAVMSMEDMIPEDRLEMCRFINRQMITGKYTEDDARAVVDWYQRWYLDTSDEELNSQLNSEVERVRKRARHLLDIKEKVKQNVCD